MDTLRLRTMVLGRRLPLAPFARLALSADLHKCDDESRDSANGGADGAPSAEFVRERARDDEGGIQLFGATLLLAPDGLLPLPGAEDLRLEHRTTGLTAVDRPLHVVEKLRSRTDHSSPVPLTASRQRSWPLAESEAQRIAP